MILAPHTHIGRYSIVALLGRGSMGEVYRARDARLNRDVALKVLPAAFVADADRRDRFEREARAAATLNHANIVAIHDVGTENDVPFLVCELLEGRTLRDVLDAGQLPTATALDYAAQIARGIAAAHDKGIIHRDLKPENIFVTRDGVAKILDFGLAKVAPGNETQAATLAGGTFPGIVLGTAGYMSPEQVTGGVTDRRSDLFAFGAVLYEMLAGRRAFSGDSAIEAMHAVLSSEVPALESVGRDLPAGIEPIVRRCLAKDPARRFTSAADLAFSLQQLGAAPERRPAAPAARRRAVAGVVVCALLAAGGVAALAVRFYRQPAPVAPAAPLRSIAVLPLRNLSGDAAQEYFADGMTEALLGDLARLGTLRVISRTSVMRYRGSDKSMPQIAHELNVAAVVDGSVARVGSKVRIEAKLVDAAADRVIWAEAYERDEQDVLALERVVSRAIADAVHATLTPADEARLPLVRRVTPAAHEEYLKGRYAFNTFTEAGLRSALEHFNLALRQDPEYAVAYAGLADTYSALRSIYVDPRIVMPPAKEAALRAIALDDTLPEAHVSLGTIKLFYEFDWDGAERELQRAIALNPNLAEARHQNALRLSALGLHADAIREIRLAEVLDPLSPLIVSDAAWISYCARDYPAALAEGRKTEGLDPKFWFGLAMLGLAYEKTGRLPEAIATLERARTLDGSPLVLEMLGSAYVAAGRTGDARAVITDLIALQKSRYVCPYEVATVYAGLGDKVHAVEWLRRAHEERADCTPWMNVDAKFDPIRNDPEFKDLARLMRFR